MINYDDTFFVAGHNGMVGSAVVRSLKKSGYKKILTESRDKLDLTSLEQVKSWFSKHKPNVVIIAAAKVGGIAANYNFPSEFLLENLKIQNNIIETSWLNGVKRLLFLGSSCIYPKYASQPIKEESLLSGYLEPTNEWYALAKISGIKLCQALRKQYGFDAFSLMPTNLYGPGDNYDLENSHVLPALIRKFYSAYVNNKKEVICWGTGQPLREFLHVDDLGDACVYSLERFDPNLFESPKDKNSNSFDFLNVGTGKDLKIIELAELIAKIIGFKGKISWDKSKPDGTPKKQLDITRIQNLGWQPKIKLSDGIKNTVDVFIKNYSDGKIRV